MISHLRGRLLEKQPNRVTIDVQGVGYDVLVPLSTFYGLADLGEEASLRIHTHVREDALLLYGFATRLELQLFERLIALTRSFGSIPERTASASLGPMPLTLIKRSNNCSSRRVANPYSNSASSRTCV